MEKLSYILDLGIGRGGEYIRRDKPNERRIGLDVCPEDLEVARKTYGIETKVANIGQDGLLFPDGTFKRVDVILPLDELMYLLAADPSMRLWRELERVLVPDGSVNIIADEQRGGHSYSRPDGTTSVIDFVPGMIFRNALKAGFRAFADEIEPRDEDELGTGYSEGLRGINDLWEIIALKTDKMFLFVPRRSKWSGPGPRIITSWLFNSKIPSIATD